MAAQIFSRVDQPDQWAKATYNLALVPYSLGHFEDAAARLHEAIGVYNRIQQPQNWAITEIDLGMVLTAQAQSSTVWEPLARQAEQAQRNTIGILTRTGPDQESARAHLNLGAVLLLEGERGGGTGSD
jgi:tetratricopeptide (TPR) repeat protein